MNGLDQLAIAVGSLLLGCAGGFVLARRRETVATPAPLAAAPVPVEVAPEPVQAANEVPSPQVGCGVPGCASRARLRGLCRKHYGKAYRLGFNEALTAEQLERLAEDRRKLPRAIPAVPPLRAVSSR